MVQREVKPDGLLRLSAEGCAFEFRRPRAGVLLVTISGKDRGQLGSAPVDEVVAAIRREGPLALFVDTRAVTGAAVSVSEEWQRFFSANRAGLAKVHILTGESKLVALTVAIAQHFSRTDDLIQLHADAAAFEARLAGASGR